MNINDAQLRRIEAVANRLRTIQMLVRMGSVATVEWTVLDLCIDELDEVVDAVVEAREAEA